MRVRIGDGLTCRTNLQVALHQPYIIYEHRRDDTIELTQLQWLYLSSHRKMVQPTLIGGGMIYSSVGPMDLWFPSRQKLQSQHDASQIAKSPDKISIPFSDLPASNISLE